jgi:hypothetical protein
MTLHPIIRLKSLVDQGLYPSVRDAAIDFVQYAQRRNAKDAIFDKAAVVLQQCTSADIEHSGHLDEWFRDFLGESQVGFEFHSFLRFRDFPTTPFANS